VETAARQLGMNIHWEGSGAAERGIEAGSGRCIVAVDPRYFRPAEVETLLGDPTKAREQLGWTPKTSFEELVNEMVIADLRTAERDALVRREGFDAPDYHE
jgi:GDPmannose 4,6-dehydratase